MPRERRLVNAAQARRRARFGDLYAAEWIKLWSLRSTPAVLGVSVTFTLYLVVRNGDQGLPIEPNHAAFDGPSWVLAMISAGMIGALSLVGEHTSGLIRTTFIAVPDRRRVAVAKAAVLSTVLAVAAVSTAVGGLILAFAREEGPGRALTDATSLRAVAASAVLLPVCALAGMAFGAVLRHAAATSFAVCTLLGFGPLLIRPGGNRVGTELANLMPYYAWGRLASGGRYSSGTMTATTACWTLAAWAALSIFTAAVLLDRRDV